MKRQIALFLLLAIAAGIVACGDSKTNTPPAIDSETSSVETVKQHTDDLPEGLKFDGEAVTFLYRQEISNEFWVETSTGDVVDDAIYDSFRSVEERLGVDINVVLRDGHYVSARQDYMDHISNTILAGDDEYDWVDLMIGNSPIYQKQGVFMDLTENKYIDLDKPYYLGGLMDQGAIDGRLYFVSGDASLGYMKCAFCLYFNQRLVEDYKIENPYDLVDSGKWTLDKLGEIAALTAEDLNGDGKYDTNDKLGFVVHDTNHPKGFWVATNSIMFTKDTSGEWQFTYGSERDADVCNKLYKIFFANDGSYFSNVTNAVSEQHEKYNQISSKFASGDIFMMTAEMDDSVLQLRNMKDDYGILPYPKYDENQEDYLSSARNTHNAFSMPVTCSNADAAGAVLEALSSSNYETVFPAYFETALKVKYSRDNDSARMYDIIRDTMKLDFGYIYSNALGAVEWIFNDSYKVENSFSSNLASVKEKFKTNLATYLEDMKDVID